MRLAEPYGNSPSRPELRPGWMPAAAEMIIARAPLRSAPKAGPYENRLRFRVIASGRTRHTVGTLAHPPMLDAQAASTRESEQSSRSKAKNRRVYAQATVYVGQCASRSGSQGSRNAKAQVRLSLTWASAVALLASYPNSNGLVEEVRTRLSALAQRQVGSSKRGQDGPHGGPRP
jgi:hypothetical protein